MLFWTLPIGIIGIIPSMLVKNKRAKAILLVVNIILAFSFLIPWISWLIFGA